jgi:hypothetical protein
MPTAGVVLSHFVTRRQSSAMVYFLATALLTPSLDLCCPAVELFCAGGVTTIAGDLGLARTGLFAKLTAIFLSGWWYTNTG